MQLQGIGRRGAAIIALMMRSRGWSAGILVLFGSAVVVAALGGAALRLGLEQFGQATVGQVVDLPIHDVRCRKGSGFCWRHELVYQFTLDGEVYGGIETLTSETPHVFKQGQEIVVHYLPARPSLSQADIGSRLGSNLVFAGFGLVFLLGGVLGLWRRLRFATTALDLREKGEMRPARVMRHLGNAKLTERFVPLWAFEWVDTEGQSGQSQRHWQADLPPLGAEVWIYADPEGRLPPVWAGDSGAR